MDLFWALLWSVLPSLALLSGLDQCGIHESSSSESGSPLLESVRCYNDYKSRVLCRWKRPRNEPMQLWFKTENSRALCVPLVASNPAEHRTVRCSYETTAFAIAITHTVFFLDNRTAALCSSAPHKSVDLFDHMRALPPVNVSSVGAGDGGRRLSWASPYPPSSSLNRNLTYQLSYRAQAQDLWTTENVATCAVTIEKRLLLPGHSYEARVRARAGVGQWSDWSPVVTWQTEEDFGQAPTLNCVLADEKEVVCSWEVSRELANLVTYQLACRRRRTAQPERCCSNPTINLGQSGRVSYSCSLTDPEGLQLELQPAHSAKTFRAHQHIHPHPPKQVKVKEKERNWIVEWTKPSFRLPLFYQVCYYRTDDEGSYVMLNISEGSTNMIIPGSVLSPLQEYQVRVRSLVVPGQGSLFEGIPSEWTDSVKWTSKEASWLSSSLSYIITGVLVVTVFFTLYWTIPACQRKVLLWVDSVPSPGKSKILSDFKYASCQTFMQTEKTSICKAQYLHSLSTCSTDILLWPSKGTQDEEWWNSDTTASTVERVSGSDTSCLSFSGPYIFCQGSESSPGSVEVQSEERYTKTEAEVSLSLVPVPAHLHGEGYVWLPGLGVSRSSQDLTSQANQNTSSQRCPSAELDPDGPESASWSNQSDDQSGLNRPTVPDPPPDYTSGGFCAWPQTGAIEASGYCHLPTPSQEKDCFTEDI
ncbi:cytokine receptor common subunit beta isoform 1-T2 [Menidia menidia]